MSQGCSSVPRLPGYYERTQGQHELVPGGFAKYLVWEKVPGEPLTEEFFWNLDTRVREDIRAKFRVAFESVHKYLRSQKDKTVMGSIERCSAVA